MNVSFESHLHQGRSESSPQTNLGTRLLSQFSTPLPLPRKTQELSDPPMQVSKEKKASLLTCLQSDAMRFKLLVEMVSVIGMPANFRLLLPRMELSELPQGYQ